MFQMELDFASVQSQHVQNHNNEIMVGTETPSACIQEAAPAHILQLAAAMLNCVCLASRNAVRSRMAGWRITSLEVASLVASPADD